MRASLTSLGRRLPELAVELAAIADGLERGEPQTIQHARAVADRALRQLCAEHGVTIDALTGVDSMIEPLLAKSAIPYTIATSVRTLFDPEVTLVGDSVRALVGFLEWRIGSRSRFAAVRPVRRRTLPVVLGVGIVVVTATIVVIVLHDPEPTHVLVHSAEAPMVRIAGATFEMGSKQAELAAALAQCRDVDHRNDCLADNEMWVQEQLRTVAISSFEIDEHEVTIADYVAWLDKHPPHTPPALPNVAYHGSFTPLAGREQLPITGVTWADARTYCEGIGRRLPTEAEWELAARGPERRTFPWGMALPQCPLVVFAREQSRPCSLTEGAGDAAPVGTALGDVTPEGIRDLGGNVSEWTADAGGERPQCTGPCSDPRADAHTTRVVRGGSWNGWSGWTRAAGRDATDPDTTRTNLGFRCARSIRAASPSS